MVSSNSNIKSGNKPNEKRSSSTISALRRRFVGINSSSQRRDRSIQDDHSHTETNPTETISADDILARYSNKGSTSVDNGSKINTTADESHTETITVSMKKRFS